MKVYVNLNYDILTEDEAYEDAGEKVIDGEEHISYIANLDPEEIWELLSEMEKSQIINNLVETKLEDEYYSREI